MENVYLDQVTAALPRVLALFDTDHASRSLGIGDRRHWAWGLSDFANGTFQGAANGLARLLKHGLLPEGVSTASILDRIREMFDGTDLIRRRDGSLEEAFPYEGSFCVTALVAYDLLTALELIGDRFRPDEHAGFVATIRPMIGFLEKADETHAFISNHLATACAALFKWHALTGESGLQRGTVILDRILARQSAEGWYCEYGGADPGYQSLCTYYLVDVLRMTGEARLRHSLHDSVRFLWHFAHPDGSFGGLYGSRNTRFYYPAGLEVLAAGLPEAAALAAAMRASIASQTVVTLASMDEPNLIPMFNAYCLAAAAAVALPTSLIPLPCAAAPFRQLCPEAGLIVDRGASHYTIVATRKGGAIYHFAAGQLLRIDGGIVVEGRNGRRYSTQSLVSSENVRAGATEFVIDSRLMPITRRRPSPWQFVVLRLLNLTVMRNMRMREFIKQIMVRMLITGSGTAVGQNRRTIKLGFELCVEDNTTVPAGFEILNAGRPFSAIHMASQGYWQAQDGRMIPRLKPHFGRSELRAAIDFWAPHPIERYEALFARQFECAEGVAFSHGRSGIYALMQVWNLKGIEVICPAYTCVVVPNAITLSGNVPVFVDCEPGHFNMSLDALRAVVTPQTRAIICTHLFGYPMNVHAVQSIATEASQRFGHKIYVVQDCAHSYGARWCGELVTRFGDAAIFGSNISKLISSIFGGMVTTTSATTAAGLREWRARRLRYRGASKEFRRLAYFLAVSVVFNEGVYGSVNVLERSSLLDYFVKYYREDRIDLPADWDEQPAAIEARVGMVQLERYEDIIAVRRANARILTDHFADDDSIEIQPFDDGSTYSHFVGLVEDRQAWLERYYQRGIQLGILIEYVVPLMAAYRAGGVYPVAASYMNRTINFPVHSLGLANRIVASDMSS